MDSWKSFGQSTLLILAKNEDQFIRSTLLNRGSSKHLGESDARLRAAKN